MPSTAEFLIDRMVNAGINDVLHVPGDYILGFSKKLENSKDISLVGTCSEEGAGFAADAYARCNGIGCVAVTYNVGALKIANAVACAYAERSPLLVISGSPGIKERKSGALLHHMVRSFECQHEVFKNWTCASTVLDNPNRAGYEIDRVLEALQYYKRPVYIELPRDIADKSIKYDVYSQGTPEAPKTDSENLQEALREVKVWLSQAKSPVILAGVELARFGLGTELVKFAERYNIPIATTLLSKSVVGETHPLFSGVYSGACSQEGTQKLVEESDCLLMFGVMLTDMTLNFLPSKFEKRQTVNVSIDGLKVRNHSYDDVTFFDFTNTLLKSEDLIVNAKKVAIPKIKKPEYCVQPDAKLTTARFFEKVDSILTEDMAIVADIGDSLFGATDLVVHHKNTFLSPAFYTSMGTSIPGALGVQLANPKVRPIVLVGDGAFQMSCAELSTIHRLGMNPIVFVLNNHGYNTERFLLDGEFNDIANWNYHKVTSMIGGGEGAHVRTEGELELAVASAIDSDELFVINVELEPNDISPVLKRMTDGLAQRIS